MAFWTKQKPVDGLIDGYRRFKRTTFHRDQKLYRQLAEKGQSPKIMVIACSDSRASPSAIFGVQPGEIFVARNVANIVPPHNPDGRPRSIGAAVEYAVKVLKVTDIVVKGHARCGGVAALISNGEGLPTTDYLKAWVEVAAPARNLLPANFASLPTDEQRRLSEYAVIQNSIMNLSGFPWVRERMDNGTLRIHGWHFDIKDGKLSQLDHESGEWHEVK